MLPTRKNGLMNIHEKKIQWTFFHPKRSTSRIAFKEFLNDKMITFSMNILHDVVEYNNIIGL